MTSLDDVLNADGLSQADHVRCRRVSARELVEAAIDRIERLNPTLNAVVIKTYDHALHDADAVDAGTVAPGTVAPGRFAGVPFLLKDLGPTCSGVPAQLGSAFLKGFHATRDAELVQRFRRAGLISLGKTNSAEFGALPTTEPAFTGPTRNPWALTASPGGSSGGAAAAVAAGLVALAHANDAGGSIRIPASCCGVFGLKPTRARIPLGPDVGDLMSGLVSEFVVSRSVRDSAALLDAVAGPMLGDPYFAPAHTGSYARATRQPERPLRIAVDSNGGGRHPECQRAVEVAVRVCEELGHHVQAAALPVRFSDLHDSFQSVWAAGVSSAITSFATASGRQPLPHLFEPFTYFLYEQGRRISAADYLGCISRMQQAARRLAAFYQEYDVYLSTVIDEPAPRLGTLSTGRPEDMLERALLFVLDTPLANLSGQPAMSVPLHRCPDGRPIGVHFTARMGEESLLLSLAAELEAAKPWADRFPALNVPSPSRDHATKENVECFIQPTMLP